MNEGKMEDEIKPDRPKGAVALGYRKVNAGVPRVLATAKGELAGQIIDIAREHGIAIYEDGTLFDSLSRLESGEEIPVKLYKAVAEVLAFVYNVSEKKKRGIL